MPDVRLSLLEQVRIASPCPARWDDMAGDDRTRHCAQCDLQVHNLSAMTADEAEDLLRRHFAPDAPFSHEPDDAPPARFCATVFRRADGTILTRDCPVGLARVRARARRAVARGALALGGLIGAALALAGLARSTARQGQLRQRDPFARVAEWIDPPSVMPPIFTPTAGGISLGDIRMTGKMMVPPARAPVPECNNAPE
ncbi:MAG: hypothetical protein AB7K52_10775 [Phycisphaerales bacterium]